MIRANALLPTLALCALLCGCGKKKDDDGQPGAAASAAASAVATEAPDTGVLIQRKPPQVGARRVVEESGELNMQLKMGARDMAITEKESNRRTEEVLAVEGDQITKLKVTYEAHTKESTEGGRTRKTPDLLSGKTFLVEVVKGKVNVTTGEGKPVIGPAKKTVSDEFKDLGKPDKVEAALPSRPLKPGDELPELGAALGEQMRSAMEDGRSGIAVDPPKVTFKRRDGELAVFDLSTILRSTKGMMKGVMITMTGELSVRIADGHPAKMSADGTLGLTPEEQAKSKGMTLTGTLKRVQTSTYP
jgi:hypothetical protein